MLSCCATYEINQKEGNAYPIKSLLTISMQIPFVEYGSNQ